MPIPGFIGKIPSQGDFVSRRLPGDFIDAWDAWMQNSLCSARNALGETWLNYYLVAPVWRFLLTEGICGKSAWLGLCFPSVDRVGRHFPLTIAVPLPAQSANPALFIHLQNWLSSVEEAGLLALDPNVSLSQLDNSLTSTPCEIPFVQASADARIPVYAGLPQVHVLENVAAQHEIENLLNIDPGMGQGTAYWQTWGSETIPSTLMISKGLLDPSAFSACLTGDWSANGLKPVIHS